MFLIYFHKNVSESHRKFETFFFWVPSLSHLFNFPTLVMQHYFFSISFKRKQFFGGNLRFYELNVAKMPLLPAKNGSRREKVRLTTGPNDEALLWRVSAEGSVSRQIVVEKCGSMSHKFGQMRGWWCISAPWKNTQPGKGVGRSCAILSAIQIFFVILYPTFYLKREIRGTRISWLVFSGAFVIRGSVHDSPVEYIARAGMLTKERG